MVFASNVLASVSFMLLSPQLWHLSVAFVVVYPPSDHAGASHRRFSERAAAATSQWARAPTTAVHADSPGRTRHVSRCRCHPPSFDSSSSSCCSRERRASEGCVVGGAGRGRRTRRRSRQRLLQARPGNEVEPPEREVIDAEFSDDFSKIVEADRASKRKKPRKENPAPHKKKAVKTTAAKKGAASAPAPAPAPFTFASSGFASLEEALASGEFADLSGGRGSCLKRVDKDGFETDGDPPKGSKIKVHYKMKVVGGENIASSGEDRTKPFEFRLGCWPSEATHGWDKAISSMHRGEVATLICGPQYAFGAAGAPPRIPPNATVETRLELESWLDLAAEYNAVPGKVETDEELRERWSEDLADGTSPMKDEAGV
ncbi:unnamed protein product, partial [Ectocarpus sp. 4 AP-2014]